MPGILVQTILFTTVYSGVVLNTDMTKGVVDRFRSLPIWRGGPLVGALLGDSARYVLSGLVIVVLGLILGFRPDGGVVGVAAAMALVIVFAFGHVVDLHQPRPGAAHAQRRAQRRVHGRLPADLPVQHLRAAGHPARGA